METCRIHGAVVAALVALALIFGCAAENFACADASSCATDQGTGVCEPNGYCSFPDDGCPSGRRFGDHGSSSVAGECVPLWSESSSGDDGATHTSATGDDEPAVESGSPPEATTAGDDTTSGAGDDSPDASSTSDTDEDAATSSTTGVETIEVSVEPVLAVCTDPANDDPQLCETNSGPGIMSIDLVDGNVNQPSSGFLRFDVSPRFEGLAVVSATLYLVVANGPSSGSPSTGALWQTEPFDLAALEMDQPGVIEPPIGNDQGAVTPGELVAWSIPVELVAGGASLHLALVPVIDDGVDYWNAVGEDPPRLEVVFATSD